jgi:hypothetical protein
MGIEGTGTANGANVEQYTCSSSDVGQIWQFVSRGGGAYELRNPNSGKCATPSDGGNNAIVELQTCTGSALQSFTLKLFGGEYYQLVNSSSGRCLDVYFRSTNDGASYELYDCDENPPAYNQAFRFVAP